MEFIAVAYKICRARKFEKLPRVLERKHHLKIELYVRLRVLFRVVHVVQNRRSALLLGTSGFHLKVKNKRFNAAASRCGQNLKYENFTSSFSRLRQNIAPKSVLHVQHDYFSSFSSFNQSNRSFLASSLPSPFLSPL